MTWHEAVRSSAAKINNSASTSTIRHSAVIPHALTCLLFTMLVLFLQML
jgi:hypothetical protein